MCSSCGSQSARWFAFLLVAFGRVPFGRLSGLNGRLPSALCQASVLRIVAFANQQMEGAIPSLTSTLTQVALHKNQFKILPDLRLKNASRTAISLHDNLLSCPVPSCGNAIVRTSIIAIGNRLQHPKREFPKWVANYERDPLFWASDVEGMSFIRRLSGAVGFSMLSIAWRLRNMGWLRTMSIWQIGPAPHLWLVQASSHLLSCLVKETLLAAVFLMFLLFWDLYACPPTFAIASACLRSSALVRALAFLCWCQLSFHSLAVEHLMKDGDNQKKRLTVKLLRKRVLLWLLWGALTVVLSTVAILYQVSMSIPGFLPGGRIWSLVLKACIGTIQGIVTGFIVPSLASKVTLVKHVFTTVSNLIMNCLIPVVIIMYLDTGCLGRWAALWKPCRSNRQLFEHRLICKSTNKQDCSEIPVLAESVETDIVVMRGSDICDPHYSWSSASMSRCIHISLLRLQEILLAKLVTTGVVMPGVAVMRDKLPKNLE